MKFNRILSWIISIFGIFLILLATYFYYTYYPDFKNIQEFFPFMAFLYSFGFGLFVFGCARHTGENIKELQNSIFLHAISDFEQQRVDYLGNPNYDIDAFLWRSLTHLIRANQLQIKNINIEYRSRLVNYFSATIENLRPNHHWNQVSEGQRRHIFHMYEIARQYYQYATMPIRQKFIRVLDENMEKNGQDEQQFYERLSERYGNN